MTTLVVNRAVLAEGLHALGDCKRCQWACENQWPCKNAAHYLDKADRLIKLGVVRDAATLATDDNLVQQVAGERFTPDGIRSPVTGPLAIQMAREWLVSIAAALLAPTAPIPTQLLKIKEPTTWPPPRHL
jgi:hypothetical protein